MSTQKDKDAQQAQIEQLIRDGITASKAGNKFRARANFEQVVGLEPANEKGWMWLSTVVDSPDEKRECLRKALALNPKNSRAKQMLEDIAAATKDPMPPLKGSIMEPATPGRRSSGGRGRPILIAVIVALVIIVLLAKVVGGLTQQPQPVPTALSLSSAATTNATSEVGGTAPATGPATESGAAVAELATGPAEGTEASTATVTPLVNRAVLPPSWTPAPSFVPAGALTDTPLPPPPPDITGHLVIASSTFPTLNKSLTLSLLSLSDDKEQPLASGETGDYGILTPDGQNVIFARYLSATDSTALRVVNIPGTQRSDLGNLWNNQPSLAGQEMVSLSRSGRVLVFAATNIPENDSTPDIYILPVHYSQAVEPTETLTPTTTDTPTETETDTDTPKPPTATPKGRRSTPLPTKTSTATKTPTPTKAVPPTRTPRPAPATAEHIEPTLPPGTVQVTRLTLKDSGTNLWPALSPDGKTIVYSNSKNGDENIRAALYVVPVAGGTPKALTSDMPDDIAAAPEWSPDGTKIAFQASAPGSKNNDIYIMDADGGNKQKIVSDGDDDIRPHWSPDGKYLAFSSTRTGRYEIFIVDTQAGTVYQVTQKPVPTVCTAWGM